MTTSTSPSKTPDRPSRPTKSRVCSNHSAACPPPNDSPTPPILRLAAEPDSDCQSCSPSPTHTVVTSTPRPGKTEASPYGYEYLRFRRNPNGRAHDWNKHAPVRGGG